MDRRLKAHLYDIKLHGLPGKRIPELGLNHTSGIIDSSSEVNTGILIGF